MDIGREAVFKKKYKGRAEIRAMWGKFFLLSEAFQTKSVDLEEPVRKSWPAQVSRRFGLIQRDILCQRVRVRDPLEGLCVPPSASAFLAASWSHRVS